MSINFPIKIEDDSTHSFQIESEHIKYVKENDIKYKLHLAACSAM